MKLKTILLVAAVGGVAYVVIKKRTATAAPSSQSTGLTGLVGSIRGAIDSVTTAVAAPSGATTGELGGVPHGSLATGDDWWNESSRYAYDGEAPHTFASYAEQSIAGVAPYSLYDVNVG